MGPASDTAMAVLLSLDVRHGSAAGVEPVAAAHMHDEVIPIEIHIPLTPALRARLLAAGYDPDAMP